MKRTKRVSRKISKLVREGVPQKQAVAMALNMSRKHKLGPRGGYRRNPMKLSKGSKLILGFILGYAGYMAYKKLRSTQTVIVSDLNTATGIPDILGVSQPGGYDYQTIAGMNYL